MAKFFKQHVVKTTTRMSAQELVARGYRRVSNAWCEVARIDRKDWVDVLAKHLGREPDEFYDHGKNEPAAAWADYYRRCLSQDTHTVSPETLRQIPSSGYDPVGFVDAIDALTALGVLR